MREIFKCDCGTHLVSIGYEQCDKTFDWDDVTIAIYDVHNPKTGRTYKYLKLIADVVLLNNAEPKELDNILHFIQKIINKRRVSIRNKKSRRIEPSLLVKGLDKKIKDLKAKEARDYKKETEKMNKRNKKRNKIIKKEWDNNSNGDFPNGDD